jgi:hypothetical protein
VELVEPEQLQIVTVLWDTLAAVVVQLLLPLAPVETVVMDTPAVEAEKVHPQLVGL